MCWLFVGLSTVLVRKLQESTPISREKSCYKSCGMWFFTENGKKICVPCIAVQAFSQNMGKMHFDAHGDIVIRGS
jgi:hypothetical protein